MERLSYNQIPKGVEVRTVDGFQGREKEIIIISLVRSNTDNEIGFLINQQRMNVLLTRAKCAMIVFGNKRTLISNELWKNWIESVPNVKSTEFIDKCLIKQDQQQTRPATTTNQNGNNYRRNNHRRRYPQ